MGRNDRRPRGLSDDESALWDAATGDVRRLRPGDPARPRPRPRQPSQSARPAPGPRQTPAAPQPAPARAAETLVQEGRSIPGLDQRSTDRLRRGQFPVDARIDLHGLTQDEAHRVLNGFLDRAQANAARCVLVITGKGAARPAEAEGIMPDRSRGVLRAMVPRWLGEPGNRDRIVAVQSAHVRHGGGGAFYVLLRRRRGAP